MFATPPARQSSSRTAPINPCLASYQAGVDGADPLTTADPIMAAMGSFFAKREAARRAELAEQVARARRILEDRRNA